MHSLHKLESDNLEIPNVMAAILNLEVDTYFKLLIEPYIINRNGLNLGINFQ